MSGSVAVPAVLQDLVAVLVPLAGAAITAGVGYLVVWLRARHANTLFVQAVQLAGGVAYNSMVAASAKSGVLDFGAARASAINEGVAAASKLATLATGQLASLPTAVDGALGQQLAADPTVSALGNSTATATAGPGQSATAVAGAGQGPDAAAAPSTPAATAAAPAAVPDAPSVLDQVRALVAAQPAPAMPAMPAAWAHTADTLARTVWAEARGEGVLGMEAVANVVANRAHHPGWWGRDVESVCLAPKQFSCWNADDPQVDMIRAVTPEDPLFREAQKVAAEALLGTLPDHTNGADHYVNLAVDHPSWAKGETPCAVIGHHTFFRIQNPAPEPEPAPEPAPVAAAADPVIPLPAAAPATTS